MWRIWCVPNNASKGQVGFNSAFKGLKYLNYFIISTWYWSLFLHRTNEANMLGWVRITAWAEILAFCSNTIEDHQSCHFWTNQFGVKTTQTSAHHPAFIFRKPRIEFWDRRLVVTLTPVLVGKSAVRFSAWHLTPLSSAKFISSVSDACECGSLVEW